MCQGKIFLMGKKTWARKKRTSTQTQYSSLKVLDEWRKQASELFSDEYTQEQKDPSSGDQMTFRDSNGDKYLTFSFYPSR